MLCYTIMPSDFKPSIWWSTLLGFLCITGFDYGSVSIYRSSSTFANGFVHVSHHLYWVPSILASKRSMWDVYLTCRLEDTESVSDPRSAARCWPVASHRNFWRVLLIGFFPQIDPETGERQNRTEAITHHDAMLFPFIGSAALLSLYIAYKFLPAYWVNLLLTLYLSIFGCVTMGETLLNIMVIEQCGKPPAIVRSIAGGMNKLTSNIVSFSLWSMRIVKNFSHWSLSLPIRRKLLLSRGMRPWLLSNINRLHLSRSALVSYLLTYRFHPSNCCCFNWSSA